MDWEAEGETLADERFPEHKRIGRRMKVFLWVPWLKRELERSGSKRPQSPY